VTRATYVSLVFVCLVSGALSTIAAPQGVKHHTFKHSWNDGTRCLRVEVLDDDLIHFETFERREPGHQDKCLRDDDMIWITPMVDGMNPEGVPYFASRPDPYRVNYKQGYQGPSEFTNHEDGIETAEVRVTVFEKARCINIYDKVRKVDLTQICSEQLDSPTAKLLQIEKKQMFNFYGVGNQFTRTTPNGDWKGMVWDASKKSGRPGHVRGPDFYGGAPSTSQFPMVYNLGPGSLNFGLFFDQNYRMTLDFNQDARYTYETYGDEIRFFVMAGPSLKDLRTDYLELTGKPPIPPKPQFGHWTSKFGFKSFAEAEDEVKALRAKGFPLDGVALDLQWFGGQFGNPDVFRMGVLQFVTALLDHPTRPNEPSFDDPENNIPRFYEQYGVHFMPIEESYVDLRLDEYKALASPEFRNTHAGFNGIVPDDGCYLARNNLDKGAGWQPSNVDVDFKRTLAPENTVWWGKGGMLDWSNKWARRYWHQLKRRWLSKMGIFNHWLDLGEPEMFHEYAYYYGFPELFREWTDWQKQSQKNIVQKHGDIHNLYGALFQPKGIEEGYADAGNQDMMKPTMRRLYGQDYDSGPRHWAMFRAGTVGSQRYGGLWSGDTRGNFENFNAQMQTQLHMSLLLDYYSGDSGGFFHINDGRTPQDHFDAVLYKQWFAVSSLLDVPLRPHGWALEPGISYGAHVRGHLDSNRANVYRRYEMIPYMYSLAHRAHRFGEAMYPPLVYFWQDDLVIRENGTEKMIGDALLMKVVAQWNGYGQDELPRTKVYLPKGTWIDYESLEYLDSDRGLSKDIDLFRRERVPASEPKSTYYYMNPLFAKEGAIIPKMYVDDRTMNALGKRWGEPPRKELIARVFTGKIDSERIVYEDDGVSRGYLQNQVRETTIRQTSSAKGATVTIGAIQGNAYKGEATSRTNTIELVVRGKKIKARGGVVVNGQALAPCNPNDVADFDRFQQNCYFQSAPNLIRARTAELSVFDEKKFEFRFE
jgi:alpha-glucosidase (family GH31 glycosyl hydrolase)